VRLAASYLIRRLSAALLSAGHRRVVACTCSSWPTASEPLGITSLFRIFRCRRLPPSRAPALFFPSVYSASIRYFPLARSRFYCAPARDPKEISAHAKGKWTKDSRNVVTSAGGIKASNFVSLRFIRAIDRSELGCLVMGSRGGRSRGKTRFNDGRNDEITRRSCANVSTLHESVNVTRLVTILCNPLVTLT